LSVSEKPKPQTVEEVKALLGDLTSLLDFEDKGDVIIANIRQYLGPKTFSRLAASIEQLGGRYISEREKWRFVIPKATVRPPQLPDLTKIPEGQLLKVPISIIRTGKFWVRKHLDQHEMSRLREAIRRNKDVTYPLACYPLNNSQLELLGGHRRLLASKEAGLLTVSVRVFHPRTEREKWEIALQDEMHEPWSPMAKARAYGKMREEGISIEDITLIAGEPYDTIKNHIALNELPEEAQQLIDTKKLGISFGLSLLKLKNHPKKCIELARNAANNAWTRQKLESEISKILTSFNQTADFPELPVTQGKALSQTKETISDVSQEPSEKPIVTPSPSVQPISPTTYPSTSIEAERDAAWDLALKHYPIGMVDFVWERVTIQGRRLQFLKVLLNVVWECIVERNMVQEVFEEAKRRFERPERIAY
jgi:ParB/RepB/Spo0J family partition protein